MFLAASDLHLSILFPIGMACEESDLLPIDSPDTIVFAALESGGEIEIDILAGMTDDRSG